MDGKEVTAETVFTAKAAYGSADVVFTFNSKALQEKTLVVFETLIYEETEIAAHTDINDEAQAVTVSKEPKTPGGGAQTGRDGLPVWLLVVGLLAIMGAASLFVYLRKRG